MPLYHHLPSLASNPIQDTSEPTKMETLSSSQEESKVGYLFGHPITHSLSPIVHQLVYKHLSLPYTYSLYDSTSLPSFIALTQSPTFYGAAITMPYKVAIIPHLSHLTPEGTAIGAINTVYPRLNPQTGISELHGTNTDCIGIREALRQNIDPATFAACAGKPALVVGGGGTSRAAVYALTQWVRAEPIYMLNRDASEVEAVIAECKARGFVGGGGGGGGDDDDHLIHITSASQARSLPAPPAVVISAIPDHAPQAEGEIMVRECLTAILGEAREKGVVLEMCYHPSPNTAIARLAAAKGWRVIPGTEAMIWQGLEQDRYWTGKEVVDMPVEEVKAAVAEAMDEAKAHI